MKNKRPIFTYIITILNSFIPASVLAVFGSAFVLVNSDTEEKFSFIELNYPSFVFGFGFCVLISLLYYFLIRKKMMTPRWWSNLTLIIISYSSVPLHVVTLGSDGFNQDAISQIGELVSEALFLSIFGFILISIVTRRSANRLPNKRRIKFKSPAWIILFATLHYAAFFMSMVFMMVFIENHFLLTGKLLHMANQILRLPLYNPLTENFISSHFTGQAGHLLFIANALIWGSLIWFIIKKIRNKKPIGIGLPIAEEPSLITVRTDRVYGDSAVTDGGLSKSD